jgi:hypothetical protein
MGSYCRTRLFWTHRTCTIVVRAVSSGACLASCIEFVKCNSASQVMTVGDVVYFGLDTDMSRSIPVQRATGGTETTGQHADKDVVGRVGLRRETRAAESVSV